ncbi:MAG: hypothetical protein IJ568_04845 [Bacilli bacterium]|nr:hypothetical protein [Bacilli bacterium]
MDEKNEKVKSIKIKNKKEAEKILSKKSSSSKVKKNNNKNKLSSKTTIKNNSTKSNTIQMQRNMGADTKKKKSNNSNIKNEKLKKIGKKTTKKKDTKTKLEIPKEWISKSSKTKAKEVTSNTTKISGKIKESIFEEVDEQLFQIQRKNQREKMKKLLLVLLIVAVTAILVIYLLFKYNGYVKKQFKVYSVYSVGDKVILKDSTVWYVVKDSDSNEENIILFREYVLDINGDTKIDNNDKLKYNTENNPILDDNNEDSVAYYLENTYKKELQSNVGEIISVGLLTTKEFIKIRDKMGFGYEWSDGNWLANRSMDNWWIDSEQNGKVYAVSPNGSFKLYNASSYNLVRPKIEIKKEFVSKYKEDEELEDKNNQSNNTE